MNRIFLRVLCWTMALCMMFSCALAEQTDVAAMPEEQIVDMLPSPPDGLMMLNGDLYAFLWNDCYRMVDGGWEPQQLEIPNGPTLGYDVAGDTLYLFTRIEGERDPETNERIQQDNGYYFIMSFEVNEDGSFSKITELCNVVWTANEENWPQICGFRVVDDAAYILMFDYSSDGSDWGNNDFWKIDLATGQGTLVTKNYLSGLTQYKDGLLLSRLYNQGEAWQEDGTVLPPELAVVNPATGDVTVLGKMTDYNSGGIAYDAATDSIYYSDQSFVYKLDAATGASETVGYLMAGTASRENMASIFYDDHYYVGDWYNAENIAIATVDPALLPTRTLRMTQNWNIDDQIREFAKAHPDVAIEYLTNSPYTAEQITRHMESSEAADIYNMYLSSGYFKVLRDKGWLVDLSSSQKLVDTVERMYPHLTREYYVDGKLYALPFNISAYTTGYYPAALEKVGMSEEDLPATYDELMDFILRWRDDYLYDFEEMKLYEWSWDLRQQIFQQIFQTQILNCEAKGELLTFNTPIIHQLLGRLDSNEMKSALQEVVPPVDTTSEVVFVMSEEGAGSIFADSHNPMPSTYRRYEQSKPLFIKLDESAQPTIQTEEYLLVVNPKSENQDLVIELLEYLADNLPVELQTAMMPDVNDPIQVNNFEENIAYIRESVARLEEQLANLPEDDERQTTYLEDVLEDYRNYLARAEEERWATSEEDIAFYRENIAPYLVVMTTSAFTGDSNQAQNILERYMGGQMSSDQFIREFDRIITMMQLENQ